MKKILCLLLCLLLTGCGAASVETVPPELTGSLTVEYLTGGALLQCNGKTALVDCGGNITAKMLENYGVETLSAIILTGCDALQTAGLDGVLEAYPAAVYAPGKVKGVKTIVTEHGGSLWLDCARLTMLCPDGEEALALQADFGEDSFLFLGAMPGETQQALAARWPERRAQMIRIHDSADPAEELLSAVEPVYVMVDGVAEEALESRFEVFDTDGFGTVTVETWGSGVELSWMFHGSVPATF